MRRPHEPTSSYRLQFGSALDFATATRLVPYLDALGISDCYASPLLQSTAGSEHGYDICNHDALNPALGSDDAFATLATALAERRMGLILDFVPNHMGLDERANRWWRDVLQHGPDSPYAHFFDIAWTPTPTHPRGRVLLPILEDGYGDVLHRGEITIVVEADEATVAYYDRRLPLAPGSLGEVTPREAPAAFNGEAGTPATWDRLHELLERQWYRIAHWKTSFDEINYRRFFDVNQLGALRMEDPDVFEATHRKVLSLIEAGWITGLRIDHPDGLLDPQAYFIRLQQAIAALPGEAAAFHIVAEKILARGELLQQAWPIAGTTGYSFLNDVNGLFVARANERALRAVYAAATGRRERFSSVASHSRRLIAHSALASELWVLTRALKQLAEDDRRTRDFTATTLSRTIAEVVAAMPIYRTYVREDGFSAFDRAAIREGSPTAR
jgi:(1->4)-alpha-D-glucan 1-alpha-D-glucosylmutase